MGSVCSEIPTFYWSRNGAIGLTLQFISRALDIPLISLGWKLGRLMNSDISRGQTDICCCSLSELPPLTQTGLVPKRTIFPPKVTVSRLIFPPKCLFIPKITLS